MTTSDGDSVAQVRRAGRRDLAFLLLLGAAGAAVVLLAARQRWAHVETTEPRPLPDNVAAVTGQTLVPVTGALALAALARLAAVLATRRTLRRIAGVVLAGFGVGIAVAVSAGISAAAVRAAAAASTGAPVGSGVTGSDIGSTTGGGQGQAAGTGGSGFPSHVVFAAFPWRGVALAAALATRVAGGRPRPGAGGQSRPPGDPAFRNRAVPATPRSGLPEPGSPGHPAIRPSRTGQAPKDTQRPPDLVLSGTS